MPGNANSGRRRGRPRKDAQDIAPQGKEGRMRTPKNAYDAAAGQDMYEPEMIVAERLGKNASGQSVTQWLVRWVGWTAKDDTWEPIEHLAGCEDMIAEFKARKKISWGITFLMEIEYTITFIAAC